MPGYSKRRESELPNRRPEGGLNFIRLRSLREGLRLLKTTIGFCAFCLILTVFCLSAPVCAASKGVAKAAKQPAPVEGLSLSECIRIALQQSPYLANSSLEIELRRLDEEDSRFALFPSVTLRTKYYFNSPTTIEGGQDPYSISFTTDSYNPLDAYISLQVRKLITQMAVLGHFKNISESVHRISSGFLEIDAMDRMAACQEQLIALAQQNAAYVSSRLNSGNATVLESRIAAQEAELAQVEAERIAASRATVMDGLKALLGLPLEQKLTLDLQGSRDRTVNHFNPSESTLQMAMTYSQELRIQQIKKELQTLNVKLAYARFIPDLRFGYETPDPLSGALSRDFYFSIGIDIPIWDGLKRYRNVNRQKTVLKQYDIERDVREVDLEEKWNAAQSKYKNAVVELKLARSREELADLKKRQIEISYESGRQPFSAFSVERKAYLEAQKSVYAKMLEHDKSILAIRHLTGELAKGYVEVASYQSE